MSCPWVGDVVQAAIRRCPFLEQLAEDHGEVCSLGSLLQKAAALYSQVYAPATACTKLLFTYNFWKTSVICPSSFSYNNIS